MSYILDALKRADAERERGAVPGLHAQPWPNTPAATPAGTSHRLWLLLAAAVALVSIALVLWLWRTPAATPTPEPAATLAQVPVPAAAPAPAKPAPTPVPPAVKAVPARPPAAPAANKTSAPPVAPTPTPTPTPTPAPTPAPAPVPLLGELPESLRSQIPALKITGAVYSDNPAQRLLLVNNQVLPQGSSVAAGVTLEDIQPRSSVFSFRGTRFRLTH